MSQVFVGCIGSCMCATQGPGQTWLPLHGARHTQTHTHSCTMCPATSPRSQYGVAHT